MKRAFRADARSWNGVEPRGYGAGEGDRAGQGYRGVTKHVIAGDRGEPAAFEVRYFEVEPGGYTRLEKHAHVHSVTVISGSGYALVGRELHRLRPLDHVYVAPMALHQFGNDGDAPLGFLCVVDARRDRPQPATDEEYASLLSIEALAGKIHR